MRSPSVTLALPAYNEEKRLEHTVLTILGQTYTDFELLLGDNCSTDNTMAIMQRLAKMDSRIRILPAEHNGGAVWNFQRLFAEARGEFFAWVGAHDYYQPNWLADLLDVISSDERIVLAYPFSLCLLPDSLIFNSIQLSLDTREMTTKERVKYLCKMSGAGTLIYGLFRTEAMRKCPIEIVIRWDSLFLARMAFQGDFVSVNQPLWYRLYEHIPHSDPNVYQNVLRRQYRVIYQPGKSPPRLHLLPVYYHMLCLLKDGIKAAISQGPARIMLTYYACQSYHARGRKNITHELRYCYDQVRNWLRKETS